MQAEYFRMRNGKEALIRGPELRDAAALIELMLSTSAETRFLGYEPDEFPKDLAKEEAFLAQALQDPSHIFLLAEFEGQLAGQLQLKPFAARRRFAHRAGLGMVLRQAFWGLGLGSRMLRMALDAAQSNGVEIVELEVVSTNRRGMSLYQSMGFSVYGTRPKAIKYADGSYADEYLMRLPL